MRDPADPQSDTLPSFPAEVRPSSFLFLNPNPTSADSHPFSFSSSQTQNPLPSGGSKLELGDLSTPHLPFGGPSSARKGTGVDGSSSTSLPLDEGSLTSRSDLVWTRGYDDCSCI